MARKPCGGGRAVLSLRAALLAPYISGVQIPRRSGLPELTATLQHLLGQRKLKGAFPLRFWPFLACLALAACGPYPRDVSGTLDRIERTHRFSVGLADMRPGDEQAARSFVGRIERATGATATIEAGPLESRLARLEHGDLDLVIAEIAEDSPWIAPVAVVEPLSTRRQGKRRLGLSPIAMNGENRWVALVEREVRDSFEASR